jgi:hypothetical protein
MSRIPEYLNLPPREAIEYFRSKVNLPTESWEQLEAEQHDLAYTIAGLTRADLLESMRFLIDQSLSEGNSFETFIEQFDRLVARRGWHPDPLPAGPADWRMRVIFETPVRRALSAGRFSQQRDPDVQRLRPYLQWSHGDSPSPRPNHLALHRQVFRVDDPFWLVAYPMCDYGCKCRAHSLKERNLKEMGLQVGTPPDPLTIAGPGFRRAAGTTPKAEQQAVLNQGIERLSPSLRSQVEQDLGSRGLL